MLEFLAGFRAGCAGGVLFWHAYPAYTGHKAGEAYKQMNMHPGREERLDQKVRPRFTSFVDKRRSLQ